MKNIVHIGSNHESNLELDNRRYRLVCGVENSNSIVTVKVHHSHDENRQVRILLPAIPGPDGAAMLFDLSSGSLDCARAWENLINTIEKSEESHCSSPSKRYKLIRKGAFTKVIDSLHARQHKENQELRLVVPQTNGTDKLVFFGFNNRLDAFELVANIRSKIRSNLFTQP